MVNRIPNGSLLTNKLGLLNSLQEYAKVSTSIIDNKDWLFLSDVSVVKKCDLFFILNVMLLLV